LDKVTGDTEDPDIPFRAYLASALTGLSREARQLVISAHAAIKLACSQLGITVYDPMDHTDPTAYSAIPAKDVFMIDRRQVLSADLLIALITEPSFGEGMELELARSTLLPVLLVVPKDKSVSKMVTGSPGVKHTVTFESVEDVTAEVLKGLRILTPKLTERRVTVKENRSNVVGELIRRARESRGFSLDDLADSVGTTVEDIVFYEENPDYITNLGLPIFRRIATALQLDPRELLLDEIPSESQGLDSVNEQESLGIYGRKTGMISARDQITIGRVMRGLRERRLNDRAHGD
jgi:transcriptional regulator with XRE-family HTH domain